MLHVLVEVEFDPAETTAETAMDTALDNMDRGLRAHNLTYVARFADFKADLSQLVYQAPDPRIRNN
jgi:hypothetical protein